MMYHVLHTVLTTGLVADRGIELGPKRRRAQGFFQIFRYFPVMKNLTIHFRRVPNESVKFFDKNSLSYESRNFQRYESVKVKNHVGWGRNQMQMK